MTSLLGFLKSPQAAGYELVGPEYTGGLLGEGNAIALRKDDAKLLEQVNSAIDTILSNGTYDKIVRKYFDFPLM